jgi:hypothetical protein
MFWRHTLRRQDVEATMFVVREEYFLKKKSDGQVVYRRISGCRRDWMSGEVYI